MADAGHILAQFDGFREKIEENNAVREQLLRQAVEKVKQHVPDVKALYAQLASMLSERPHEYYSLATTEGGSAGAGASASGAGAGVGAGFGLFTNSALSLLRVPMLRPWHHAHVSQPSPLRLRSRKYNDRWRIQTTTVVFLLAFVHFLEARALLSHRDAESILGRLILVAFHSLPAGESPEPARVTRSTTQELQHSTHLPAGRHAAGAVGAAGPPGPTSPASDRAAHVASLQSPPRYVVNRVTAGDYECARQVAQFLGDLYAGFRMLNLRNDALRKRYDGKTGDLCVWSLIVAATSHEVQSVLQVIGLASWAASAGMIVLHEGSSA
eukprot:jgi/Mesen1/1458/ME000132S00404